MRISAKTIGVYVGAGFVLGVAAYAVIGPYRGAIDPLVQAALITLVGAAVAGLAGGLGLLLGSQLTAAATRRQAELASKDAATDRQQAADTRREEREEARLARQEDREEARLARFSDRIRQLAAQLQVGSVQVVRTVSADVEADSGITDDYEGVPGFYEIGQELRLIVRLERTYLAIDRLTRRVSDAEEVVRAARRMNKTGSDRNALRFGEVLAGVIEAYNELEDAARIELGVPAVPFEAKFKSYKDVLGHPGPAAGAS